MSITLTFSEYDLLRILKSTSIRGIVVRANESHLVVTRLNLAKKRCCWSENVIKILVKNFWLSWDDQLNFYVMFGQVFSITETTFSVSVPSRSKCRMGFLYFSLFLSFLCRQKIFLKNMVGVFIKCQEYI